METDFQAFVAARSTALFRGAYVLTGNREAAEDLVQETLERACRTWRTIAGKDAPDLYVRRIMVNLANDRWRRFRRLVMTSDPESGDNAAHAALARFLFRNAAAQKRVGELSGGERLRAALACVLMAARPPQLLILDEPTNHLDLDSVAAMEAALRGYDGALLIASHDADFLRAVGVEREVRLPLA